MSLVSHITRRVRALSMAAVFAVSAAVGLGLSASEVRADEALAPAMGSIDVEEHLGLTIDTSVAFKDHEGKDVTLADYLDGERPVLLSLNYYRCPVLCSVQLNELTTTLSNLDWTAGDENFRIVTVSIDPRETPALAKEKRASHLKALGRGDDVDWSFLTGDVINIRSLAAQVGMGYAYDSEQDQYAHPAVLVFLSPEGKIARYVYGLTTTPQDLKFGLMEASEGKVGTTVDRIILSCFHYDSSIGRYGPFAFGIMRLGGVLSVLVLGSVLLYYWRRERRQGVKAEAISS
ncbi:MAG: SCO family protein [Myxococcales bacterium]|nr:SCO family protein [Myxococcales bacterium]